MKLCPKCRNHFPDDANFCPVDAGRLEAIQEESAAPAGAAAGGELGGRFDLGVRAGGELTGEVYDASDKQTGQACTVKLVDPSVFPTPLLLQRTERELRQLVRLDAPGVAKVLDHGKRDGQLWIATEKVEGRSLDEVVASDGPMASDRAAKILHTVGQALAEAAKLGVIHRDLAPKNLILRSGDEIKIINFGVAVPTTEKIQGVPEFVAPEQIEGKPVDQRSNIYSLGALYYFMLTGAPPYTGDVAAVHQAHLDGNPPAPADKVEVSDHVNALVLKALERSSSKRFMTLRQLLGQLEGIIEGSGPGATQPLGRVGQSTTPGVAKPLGKKGKDAALGGTMLGMPVVAQDSDDDARRDNALTIPIDKPPTHEPAVVDGSQATQKIGEIPVKPQAAPVGASPDSAPGGISSAPAGKGRVEVDDNAATRELAVRPVSVSDDTAPSPMIPMGALEGGQQRAAGNQPRPASHADADAQVAGKPGKKKKKKKGKGKGKFRETMWFKKGELDEAAAEAASHDRDALASSKADEMSMEDRYDDDGTLSNDDQQRLSLRSGSTADMPAIDGRPGRRPTEVSEEELVREMSGGGKKIAIIAGVALVVVIIVVIIALK